MHPDGEGSRATNEELRIAFDPPPDYGGIAKAAACGKAWTGQVTSVIELKAMLPQAFEAVHGGMSAVLDVHVKAPETF